MTTTNRSNVLCRYFANNCCNKGDSCAFSHDRSQRSESICRYYLRGECAFGSSCRYDHVRPRQEATAGRRGLGSGVATQSSLRSSAAEFVPKKLETVFKKLALSDASPAADADPDILPDIVEPVHTDAKKSGSDELCPYFVIGQCYYGDNCSLLHGNLCELCNQHCLHPADAEHNAKHHSECVAEHEKEMEKAFAEARSDQKQCGICMELVVAKEVRFGILQNCRHCFCLDCIRTWRQSQFDNKLVRSCPECRTHSDYIVPCKWWVEEETEKKQLIDDYKRNAAKRPCKYFKKGELEDACPFGNKCFYQHAKPDGTLVTGDSPRTIRRRKALNRPRTRHMFMWDFMQGGRDRNSSEAGSENGQLLDRLLQFDLDLVPDALHWSDTDDSSDDTFDYQFNLNWFD